jgi:TonB family protein
MSARGRWSAVWTLLFAVSWVPPAVGTAAPDKPARDVAQQALEGARFDEAAPLVRALARDGDPQAQLWLGFMHLTGAGVPWDSSTAQDWLQRAAAGGSRLAAARLAMGDREDPRHAEWLAQAARPTLLRESLPATLARVERGQPIPNLQTAYFWNVAAAERGHADALYAVARYRLYGVGGRADPEEYARLLRTAADAGSVEACLELALVSRAGLWGIAEDAEQARRYELRAAELGHAETQLRVGRDFVRGGSGRPRDLDQARRWLEAAAAQENLEALEELADLLRDHPKSDSDVVRAVELYALAAARGSLSSHVSWAWMHEVGRGVPADPALARRTYEETAAAGHAWSWTALGRMRRDGTGGPQDPAGALAAFREGARLGHPGAMRELAKAYLAGRGVDRDPAQAFEWMEEAARTGDRIAQFELGQMLLDGTGIEPDVEEALHWFNLSAEKDYRPAKLRLVSLYTTGVHVPQNRELAERWLVRAGATFDPDLPQKLDFVVREIALASDPEQARALLAQLQDYSRDSRPLIARTARSTLLHVYASSPNPAVNDREAAARLAAESYADGDLNWGAATLARFTVLGAEAAPRDWERARALLAEVLADSEWGRRPLRAFVDGLVVDARRLHDPSAAAFLESILPLLGEEDLSPVADRIQHLKAWFVPDIDEEEFERRVAALGPRPKNATAQPVHQVAPEFPHFIAPFLETGRAEVRFTVETDGRVTGVVVQSATHPAFGEAATAAVQRWRFAPALKDGKPVRQNFSLPLSFMAKASPE